MTIIINLFLAVIEGLGIIISPCILPVLPIILSVGMTGGKTRPYGIMIGFISAFCVFTLLSRFILYSLHIDLEILRNISLVLLAFFGIVMMSNYLSDKFTLFTQVFANFGEKLINKKNDNGGFWSGIFIGLPIGLIWTPCAGPIIAAVIVQTIRAQTSLESIFILIAFTIGVAIPMLIIILFGKSLLLKTKFIQKHSKIFRKILGIILIVAVIFNIGNVFYQLETTFPSSQEMKVNQTQSNQLINALAIPYQAPQIKGITDWVNSTPLTIKQLKGKVVLIDFWTYSCINCVRTLPYLIDWYNQYHTKGLVIIGIQSPEFIFEKNLSNVENAVKQYGIPYPVALDNDYQTWDNYNNHYWPAHYLIDKNGYVVYVHFGEGDYKITENNIRVLLGEKANNTPENSNQNMVFNISELYAQTPETYLGSARAERFVNEKSIFNTSKNYVYPNQIPVNFWALQGNWEQTPQYILSLSNGASIKLHFHAKNVFLVLSPENNIPVKAQIFLNDQLIGKFSGKDVKNNIITVSKAALYEIVNLPKSEDSILEIKTAQPGLQAYAFTFGS